MSETLLKHPALSSQSDFCVYWLIGVGFFTCDLAILYLQGVAHAWVMLADANF